MVDRRPGIDCSCSMEKRRNASTIGNLTNSTASYCPVTKVDAAGNAVATGALAASGDGQWRGTLGPPEPGTYRLGVTACFATNGDTWSTDVAVP